MGYDAMMASGASIPATASAAARDAGKKKRNNRSAKLKQCKLDARREQWLSQVKGKGDCKTPPCVAKSPTSPPPAHLPRPRPGDVNLKTRNGVDERDELVVLQENSDLESPTNNSVLLGNRRLKNFPSNSISSGSSIGSCSRSVSDMEEEEIEGGDEENEVLDDWEAVADALSEDDPRSPYPDPVAPVIETAKSPGTRSEALHVVGTDKPQPIQRTPRAWRLDDTSRPQSLPSITKQWSFPSNMERHFGSSHQKDILSFPSPCPICYEDLDPTDTSFLPCSCGFHLCLFCHKRILEADGRCPGCRKQYDTNAVGVMDVNKVAVPVLPYGLPRSCSMNARF